MKLIRLLYVAHGGASIGGYSTRIISQLRLLQRSDSFYGLVYFIYFKDFIRHRNRIESLNTILHELCKDVYLIPSLPFFRNVAMLKFSLWIESIIVFIIVKLREINILQAESYAPMHIAAKVKQWTKVKVVFDVHGVVDQELQITLKNSRWKKELINWAIETESQGMSQSDYLIFVSPAMKSYFINKYYQYSLKSKIIPCAVDSNIFYLDHNDRTRKRKELGLESKLAILYMGSMDSWQCFREILFVGEKYERKRS